MGGGGGAGFGVEFFYGFQEEFVGMRAGDEVFVCEEESGDTLETKTIGFLPVVVDQVGEPGIFEGGGDAERVEAS